jgi:hypothetical protein
MVRVELKQQLCLMNNLRTSPTTFAEVGLGTIEEGNEEEQEDEMDEDDRTASRHHIIHSSQMALAFLISHIRQVDASALSVTSKAICSSFRSQ